VKKRKTPDAADLRFCLQNKIGKIVTVPDPILSSERSKYVLCQNGQKIC